MFQGGFFSCTVSQQEFLFFSNQETVNFSSMLLSIILSVFLFGVCQGMVDLFQKVSAFRKGVAESLGCETLIVETFKKLNGSGVKVLNLLKFLFSFLVLKPYFFLGHGLSRLISSHFSLNHEDGFNMICYHILSDLHLHRKEKCIVKWSKFESSNFKSSFFKIFRFIEQQRFNYHSVRRFATNLKTKIGLIIKI